MNNAVPIGLGGGGTMFAPQVSPHDPTLMFLACDMTGLYRSTDQGKTWFMCDARQVQSYGAPSDTALESPYGFAVAFHPDPTKSLRVLASHTRTGLMVSDQAGDDDSWNAFTPSLPLNGDGFPLRVLAAGFSRDFAAGTDATLLLGVRDDSQGTFGLYHLDNQWAPSTYTNGTAITARVLAFCFFNPSQSTAYFCATTNDVMLSNDKGRTWISIKSPSGGALPGGFTVTGICNTVDMLVVTVANAAGTQGVYRYPVAAGSAAAWSAMNSGLNLSAGYLYQFIASADDRDTQHPGTTTLFVTAVTPGLSAPNVFRSRNAGTWEGVYAGYHTAGASPNVTAGWLDEAESPIRRGWGFGGPAWGFTVAPSNADVAVFTNQAVCDVCENGTAPASAVQWDNRYTLLTSGPPLSPSERWRSTGLDVTTVWKYFIHPSQPDTHFICYTDIGLARSDDGGLTWATISVASGSGIWGNYYDLISDATGANLWAAVSAQHDIPHDTQTDEMRAPIGAGAVITSTDDGLTWTPYSGTGLPNGPVISLILANGVLYASVWGSGIYKSILPAGAWTAVGSLATGGAHPHCCRIDFVDSAQTDLYCVIAADTTGAFVPGGLYHLPNAPTAQPATAWIKLSGTLETLIANLTPPGNQPWRLVPLDFALDPFRSEPGVHYLCTADGGGRGGGGIYKYTRSSNTWAALAAVTRPFATSYNDGLEVFSIFFFNGVRYATSSTHGIWFSADDGNNWQEYKVSNFIRSHRILFPKLDATTGLIAGDPSSSPFFISTFGGSAIQIPRGLFFILELATAVKSLVVTGNPIPHALYVVFENFLAAETGAGIQSAGSGLSYVRAPQITFSDATSGAPIAGMQLNQPTLSIDDLTLLTDTPQRFVFEYELTFTDTLMFPPNGSRAVTVRATLGPYSCSTELVLLTDFIASPQLDNGATSWVSDALRVFHVAEGAAAYPGGPTLTFNAGDTPQSAALTFLAGLLNTLNGNPTLFGNFSTGETTPQSTLYWHQYVQNVRQYNFALARVEANPQATTTANNVQVFFRLFTTAVSYTSYDPIHTYRRIQQASSTAETPLLGIEPPIAGGTAEVRIATIPCFGSPRLDYSQQSTAAQIDPRNRQNVASGGTTFFACWLDFNQPDPRYPLHPTDDGPFAAGSMKSIQELIRGNHQCLVAEIFSPQSDSIVVGTLPPAGFGVLAQRNLSIDESSNPAESADSRTVSHTFEIGGLAVEKGAPHVPDDLMIDWGNVPMAAKATLFLPEVNAHASAQLAARHSGSKRLQVIDAHTLRCAVGGITLLPVVTTERRPTPALLTVELPPGVVAGQIFRLVIRQISGLPRQRRVTGMFQFSIPVRKTTRELLQNEERKLGVLRWVLRSLPDGDSWSPVMAQYLQRIAARVRAFDGHPAIVRPSPYGGPRDGPKGCFVGWLEAIARMLGFGRR